MVATLLGVNLWFVACALPLGLGPLRALLSGTFGLRPGMELVALLLGGIGALAPLGVLWFGKSLRSGPLLFALVTLWPELLVSGGVVQPAPFWWVALLWFGYLFTAHASMRLAALDAPTRVRISPPAPDESLPVLDGLAAALLLVPMVLVEAVLHPWRLAGGVEGTRVAAAAAVLGLVSVGTVWFALLRWGVMGLLRAHLSSSSLRARGRPATLRARLLFAGLATAAALVLRVHLL